jgi:hypothetical protein
VKKKEGQLWSWSALTKLHKPPAPGKKGTATPRPLTDVKESPLGKLYATVRAFTVLESSGRFISNAGCDLTMANGANAATSLPVALAGLPPHFANLLSQGLSTLHTPGDAAPDLSRMFVERVDLPVNDPMTYTVGTAHRFLQTRSPRHAGQARSLVETLLAKIGPLGAKTDTCKTFEELRKERGYSRSDFANALAALEETPDLLDYLNTWLDDLSAQGMGAMDRLRISAAAASAFRHRLAGTHLPLHDQIDDACDAWLADKPEPVELMPFFTAALAHLRVLLPSANPYELQARFAIRAISKCLALT